ncbi:polyphosphate kinase 1 [Dysgonomonas sp. 216]|uniref:polyphosphate kinase 1 n=1 Tax=Dysgonomonas sp. 216 TaxID=2302934 RepID=UPI0013D8C00E|nr:polyphosphate kinase 1 [Dysgonomonas sp. 216]NDW19357.1 polyphosphate kinase 1 [Dysgonomonas sp. 216]
MKIINRELSWLAFNERVLQEAQDKSVPLMQRLRFLGIYSNNQDEFVKVRVANLIRITRRKQKKTDKTIDGYTAKDLLNLINQRIDDLQHTFTDTYIGVLSEMEKHGIYVINETQLSEPQKQFCREYFLSDISQWLVPLIIRKTTKMPFLSDNKIYLAAKMVSANGKNIRYSIIQIPVNRTTPRFVELPSEEDRKDIIFLDDIVRLCLDEIFFMFNYESISAYTFKFIRDGQLTVDDDISKSVIEKMEQGLEERLHGEPVRLVYDREMPDDLLQIIISKLKLKSDEVLGGGRYHMMKDLMKFPSVRPDLESILPAPLNHPDIKHFSSIVDVIKKKDVFLNFPYHSFNHVINFLREAAIDPKVKKIYITLYRTAEQSRIINALINAAKNGKEVIVLEELMARFDEEQNVENSDRLQKAGVRVIHGFKNLKVHCKLIYIERNEKKGNKGYVYIGTGNFNETTARIYGDFGLLTANQRILLDTKAVFDFLLNMHKRYNYKSLMVSPYTMRMEFESLIEKEIKNKQKGKEAYIYAKLNSLTDSKIIKLLYKASQAGVEIRLIIRGACCLVPQIKGQSENIRVISIVDTLLEHARTIIFCNEGNEQIYISSADWMTRNLDARVEVAVPIYDKSIQKVIKDIFNLQWSDNVKAREFITPDDNQYVIHNVENKVRSQKALYEYYKKKL